MTRRYRLPLFAQTISLNTGVRKEASSDGWFYPRDGIEEVALQEAGCLSDDDTDQWVRSLPQYAPDGYGGLKLVDNTGASVYPTNPQSVVSPSYHFAGWARDQIASATSFYDQSGMGNHGVFMAGLTAAAAWATPGLLTIANPTGLNTVLQIPPINFDYGAGESLCVFWRGFSTPEASDQALFGDNGDLVGPVQSHGMELKTTSTGKAKFNLRDSAGALFAGGTTARTVAEAAVEHTFAVVLDGVTRKYGMYVDGYRDDSFSSNYLTYASGNAPDFSYANKTLKLSTNGQISGGNIFGVQSQTRALHVLRRAAGLGLTGSEDAMIARLHRDPTALVSKFEW